jgi:hypothetical protein
MCLYASYRSDYKAKGLHSIELFHEKDEEIKFLSGYDGDHLAQWLEGITKARRFYEWYS